MQQGVLTKSQCLLLQSIVNSLGTSETPSGSVTSTNPFSFFVLKHHWCVWTSHFCRSCSSRIISMPSSGGNTTSLTDSTWQGKMGQRPCSFWNKDLPTIPWDMDHSEEHAKLGVRGVGGKVPWMRSDFGNDTNWKEGLRFFWEYPPELWAQCRD